MEQRESISKIKTIRTFQNRPVSYSECHFHQGEEYDRLLFAAWEIADRIVEHLEEIRDANIPNSPNEEWNELFCKSIEALPKARQFAEECWLDYITYRR